MLFPESNPRWATHMIFVTVGNATQGFRRLLDAVDALAGKGFFCDDSVMIQVGHNPDFQSMYGKQEKFLPMEQFAEMICKADLVISHAGAGTLLHVLQAGKVPIVMPRRQQFGEHVDDHQLELVKTLSSEGRIIPAYEPEDLPEAIAEARRRNSQPVPPPPSQMLDFVAKAIEELMCRKR